MFVVVAAQGKTGRSVVDTLLAAGERVRGIVRKTEHADALRRVGAESVLADVGDTATLARAMAGAEAVYLMNPPAYTEPDLFARASQVHDALVAAAEQARVGRIVALSSVGAQHAEGTGNILTTHHLERRLASVTVPVTVLRAANFLDNWAWVLEPARQQGVLPSMLLPLDRKIPSVAAVDVGRAAASLMREGGAPRRLVELHGPTAYSPDDAAAAFRRALGRAVLATAVPEDAAEGVFRQQGMPEVSARAFAAMYRGFNQGLIAFEGTHETGRGATSLDEVVRGLTSEVDQVRRPTP